MEIIMKVLVSLSLVGIYGLALLITLLRKKYGLTGEDLDNLK